MLIPSLAFWELVFLLQLNMEDLPRIAKDLSDKNKLVRRKALEGLASQISSLSSAQVAESSAAFGDQEMYDLVWRPILGRLNEENERNRELAAAIMKQLLGRSWRPPAREIDGFLMELLHTLAAR